MKARIHRTGNDDPDSNGFMIKMYAVVAVTSKPIQAKTIEEAIQLAHASIDFDQLLRNITPSPTTNGVEFTDSFTGAEVHLAIHGVSIAKILDLNEEQLEEVLA